MGGQELPPRFPCWCRATYSWGGETKKDLGFIEGDLIEALNAGDGSWWMGRLRRDPRAIGLFPSNFVKTLDESFQPAPNTRNATASTRTQKQKSTPVKSKFRPFSSMKTAQAPTGSLKKDSDGRPVQIQEDTAPRVPAPPPRPGSRSPRPPPMGHSPSPTPTPTPGYGAAKAASMYRAASPQPRYHPPRSPAPSRPHSPLPDRYHDGPAYPQLLQSSREPSPNPYQLQEYHFPSRRPSPTPIQPAQYRALSPQPSYGFQNSRAPSPAPFDEEPDSSPPPPPPAHRVAYQQSRPQSPQPYYHQSENYEYQDDQTPIPPSPGGGSHMTPSPLRDAMNDVMSSLQDMSVLQQSASAPPARAESPPSVWSPDAFDMVRSQSRQQHRGQSSLGFAGHGQHYGSYEEENRTPSLPSSRDGPPQLDNFVQRMERQLRHTQSTISYSSDHPPAPPLKGTQYSRTRPTTSSSHSSHGSGRSSQMHPNVRHRKSAYELGREALSRTYTTKTNATNSTETSSATQSSNSTQATSRSLMSGYSAGGFSATSAGSLARKRFGLGSQKGRRELNKTNTKSNPDISSSARSMIMSETSGSGPSYHDSHASGHQQPPTPSDDWTKDPMDAVFGGLNAPKAKKSNFFKKMIDSAKTTARTGAANARSTIGSRPGSRAGSSSPTKSFMGEGGMTGMAGGLASRPDSAAGGAAKDMGLGGGDWMQVRRDINRSNSLSRRELDDRAERCEMLDIPVLNPIDQLHEYAEGDEGLDGLPVMEPTEFNTPNLALVDKSTRFIQSVPSMINPAALAQSYICRPHRSDVQRLRAIFTWVAERITWEEDFEGQVDTRRVVQTKRGCSEEIAVLVRDMCNAVGLHSEVIRGYLKAPGEVLDLDSLARPNHWWNAVIVDGEWRIMDCSLASPTHPKRSAYSSANSQVAESWYFLARPMEICYTHMPLLPEQQHIVPPVAHEILIALPCACPTYFRNAVELTDFETSVLHMDNLEMVHLHLNVPEDVECVAETEARSFAQDADGDFFESGDVVTKKALAQPEWVGGRKTFKIKALLPGDEGQGVLKIYAGKRGLMHSIKDNPHSLALALPLTHTGQNPPYNFLVRHPTPHAQRHDLCIAQPQCSRLVLNNTFVFCVRQHPSSLSRFTPDTWGSGLHNQSQQITGRPTSPNPYVRPTSAMSMVSATMSTTGSNYSDPASSSGSANGGPMTAAQLKPAKLAIQTPSQKIIRLMRKEGGGSAFRAAAGVEEEAGGLTTTWETVIKIGERGTWRALVLADRSARWCVFGEWECV